MNRWLLLSLSLSLIACAPDRSTDDDDTGFTRPGNDLRTALFTIVDYGETATAQEGRLVLADADLTCADLDGWGGLRTWELSEETAWVSVGMQHGISHQGWLMDYESQQAWSDGGGRYDATVAYFSGQVGVGWWDGEPPGDGTDPGWPNDPRDVEPPTMIGVGTTATDDVVRVTMSDDLLLGGYLETHAGDYAFEATKCPDVNGDVPVGGGGDVDGGAPTPG